MKKAINKMSMTWDERYLIRRYAEGERGLKQEVILVYRKVVRASGLARGTLEKDFMAEVDNTHPDLTLRSKLRIRLLAYRFWEQEEKP